MRIGELPTYSMINGNHAVMIERRTMAKHFDTLDTTVIVTVRLTNIVYDAVTDDGVDHAAELTADDIPDTLTFDIEVEEEDADDEELLLEAALEQAPGDWCIEDCDFEVLESEDA